MKIIICMLLIFLLFGCTTPKKDAIIIENKTLHNVLFSIIIENKTLCNCRYYTQFGNLLVSCDDGSIFQPNEIKVIEGICD